MLGLQKEALWSPALLGGPPRVDSAKDFPMDPERTEVVVEGLQGETAAKAVEMIPSFGSALTF